MPTITTVHQLSHHEKSKSHMKRFLSARDVKAKTEATLKLREYSLIDHIEDLTTTVYESIIPKNLHQKESTSNYSFPQISTSGNLLKPKAVSEKVNSAEDDEEALSISKVLNELNPKAVLSGDDAIIIKDILNKCSSNVNRQIEDVDINSSEELILPGNFAKRRKSKGRRKRSLFRKSPVSKVKATLVNHEETITCEKIKPLEDPVVKPESALDTLTVLCKTIKLKEAKTAKVRHELINLKRSLQKSTEIEKKAPNPSQAQNSFKKAVIAYSSSISKQKLVKNSEENAKTTKIFLSEKQSKDVEDDGESFPGAPPATPTVEQLRKYEYIPSLYDIRAQRSFSQRLKSMEKKELNKDKKKQDEAAKAQRISLREQRMETKKRQRQEIYALNKAMTDLENERFLRFMAMSGAEL